ncbi:MAG: SDR family NAD(P)-dependent oxidoreductase [Planctomycetes bacterium]|nr:SDR family NAD(P)-dependent oxidoreductase [Planctomycetota bacterium]
MIRAMDGKTVIVTGAGSGIGKVSALELAKKGALVVLVARSEDRIKPVHDAIAKAGGKSEILPVDLSSKQAIRDGAAKFLETHDKLDVLLNNAGLWVGKREVTADGLERTWAVNALAPFMLTQLMLEPLRAAKGRVINVASEEHTHGFMNWDDIQYENQFDPALAYRQSKLALVMQTLTLAEREAGVITANCLHPGIIGTNLFRNFPGFIRFWINLLMLSPEKGAQPQIRMASEVAWGDITGKYYVRFKEGRPHGSAQTASQRERLWKLLDQQAGA